MKIREYLDRDCQMKFISSPPEKRMLSRIICDISTRCWIWTGGKTRGFGVIRVNGKADFIHRFIYRLYIGEIPEKTAVIQTCKNKTCCNPEHLVLNPHFTRTLGDSPMTLEQRKARKKEIKIRNRIRDPHKAKEQRLRQVYGIGIEDYEKILAHQKYVCAICGIPQKNNKHFHIDHCHKTGEVRGVLCATCNRGLGCFEDSVSILKKAIGYLNGGNRCPDV